LLTDESVRALASRRSISGFNPRPSLLTDESRIAAGSTQPIPLFQSTSVIADGRILSDGTVKVTV